MKYNNICKEVKNMESMVIDFGTSKKQLFEKKQKRFTELKIGYFEDRLSVEEIEEFNELGYWMIIHNV